MKRGDVKALPQGIGDSDTRLFRRSFEEKRMAANYANFTDSHHVPGELLIRGTTPGDSRFCYDIICESSSGCLGFVACRRE